MPQFAGGPGWLRGHFHFNVRLALVDTLVEYLTDWTPGFRFIVVGAWTSVMIPGVGASATRLLRVLKGTSTVVASGTLTEAGTATAGTVLALTNGTADARAFGDSDTLSIDYPAGGTVFTAGDVNLVIQYIQQAQQR